MAVTTTSLAKHMRLPPDERTSLKPYLDAAVSKAATAGIPKFKKNAQYDLFIMELATMYYDNRGLANPDAEAAQRMVDSFVLELRHAEDV